MVHWRQIQNSASIQKPTKYRDLKKKKRQTYKDKNNTGEFNSIRNIRKKKKEHGFIATPL